MKMRTASGVIARNDSAKYCRALFTFSIKNSIFLRVLCGKAAVLLFAFTVPVLAAEQADVILHHGKIVTVDDYFTVAQALAIKGERVIAAGSNGAIAKLAGAGTRKIDLKGRTV